MAMDRYNSPVVRSFFDHFFMLSGSYQSTRERISELYTNVPAGVVEEEIDPSQREQKVAGYITALEGALFKFEKIVPQEVSTQRDIADLLSDVRCYIDAKRER